MSAHPHAVHIPPPERLGPGKLPLGLILAVTSILGIILCSIGLAADPRQFIYSWFIAFYFFFTIALGSFFWVTLHMPVIPAGASCPAARGKTSRSEERRV